MMRRVSPLPSLLTLGNLSSGFVAIVLCAQSLYWRTEPEKVDALVGWACACVFFGMLFDMLDGRVARMTGGESRFGAELDSLADVVTFGAVPAAIVSSLWIRHQPDYAKWWSLVMVCGLVYVACAALRLARYNVEKSGSDKRHFRGLPSPAAAGVVVSATLFARQPYMEGLWQRVGHLRLTQSVLTPAQVEVAGLYLLGLYMLIIGLLMVTRQRFVHAANRWLHGRQRFTVLVVMVFALALLRLRPVEVLFAAFNGYVLASLAANGARALRERRRLAPVGSDGAAAKSAAEEADAPAGAAGAEGETRGPGGGRS